MKQPPQPEEQLLPRALTLPAAELPQFLGTLVTAGVAASMRHHAPAAPEPPEEAISRQEAARRLGISLSRFDHHWREKYSAFVRKEGTRVVVSARGLQRHIDGQTDSNSLTARRQGGTVPTRRNESREPKAN